MKNQLKHCNLTLVVLDKLEENRPLFTQEHNFQKILKKSTFLSYCSGKKSTRGKDTQLGGLSLGMKAPSSSMPQQQKDSGLTLSPAWTLKVGGSYAVTLRRRHYSGKNIEEELDAHII
jgi:hypothetical protein